MTRTTPMEPIAIIGAGLRLPGADSLDAFWAHLAAGRSLITEVAPRRWSAKDLRGNPTKENKTNSIWGGFLDDADAFDAAFFNISPREASWMDPQQRFALEMAWHAIEDAGMRASDIAGSDTGVYMGVCHWDYAELIEKHLTALDAYTPTGIAFSVIANRVSHFFDFKGPSVTNDTACAASLVSIYEAVRALQNGECGLALAGGVNLAWSPNHFVAFAKSGMLSKDGKAKAFDARADGYVRGEGGAMLLLKPLGRAEADGDPIHAVIRGIGTNHGGRTSSLTVTNPSAQAELIAQVHRDAGITPDAVSYIEAHGPGTPLGDPIEIAGLKAAFRARVEETGLELAPRSCGIGSVKTNIGHLEGAAGVAGVVKVLAALRHETLPPNVGFETLNPLIDLSGTPFRIQSEQTRWPRESGKVRRAGVSSFGFGGTNAHAVIEEAPARPGQELPSAGPVVLPLSARTDAALHAYAQALRNFLDRNPSVRLADLALTFQAGREAMRCRVAFVADDMAELRDALSAFLEGAPDSRVRLPGSDAAEAEPWRTADQWASGTDSAFAAPLGARRISAPLHPFQRERYWIDAALGAKDTQGVPHPFLHRNLSTFDTVTYASRFTGTEYVLADHHVHGRKVLPGVVGLEMARAAYANASSADGAVRLTDIVWSRAIAAGEGALDIGIRLTRASNGLVDFAVSVRDDGADGPVCVQGSLQSDSALPTIHDLAALRASAKIEISPDTCYARLSDSGVVHGPAFQAITAMRRGDGFVLADLRLPRRLAPSLSELPLHPVLLDAAIQAWVALADDAPHGAGVPFACREIHVLGPCDASMVAYVRPAPGARSAAGILRLDIDLCDRNGVTRVAFRELALRLVNAKAGLAAAAAASASHSDSSSALVLARGAWEEADAPGGRAVTEREVSLFVAAEFTRFEAELAARTGFTVRALPETDASDAAGAAGLWLRTLTSHLSAAMAERRSLPRKFVVLLPGSFSAHVAAPLVGLLRTLPLEQPKMSGAVVHVAGICDIDRLASIASSEARAADTFVEIRHDAQGKRLAWRAVEIPDTEDASAMSVDPEGVYWITGGLGGLGLIFAEALAARGAIHIVLSGRGAAKPDALARIAALRAGGADIHVLTCDIADRSAVDKLVATIEEAIGPLRGIIHAAGVLDDAYIFGSDTARIDAVLVPKVAGTLNIDAATAHLDLSFFVLCSSIASAFGNAGQAAYAGANAFMDAFAEHRAELVAAGERRGLTCSIAWPLWAEGGMGVEAPFLEALRRRFGTEAMPSTAGIEAFWRLLSAGARGVALYGNRTQIDDLLTNVGEPVGAQQPPRGEAPLANTDLLARTTDHLKELLSDATQIDVARIRATTPLAEYGLDSIVIVDVTARLEKLLGPLSKTLFFEHVTLASLAQHLVEDHAAALSRELSGGEVHGPASPAPDKSPQQPLMSSSAPTPDDTHDVAIIGLSLRVAKAATQDAFWEMLSKGLHGVGPIPAERWNHKAIYHPERDVLGKSVVKTGAFLDDIDTFDPRYFRISQAEAELMSPEVRLFLEASVEAFEDAGYSRETMQAKYGGDVAVLVGSMTNEYDYYGLQNMLVRGAQASGSYTGTVPNMVSYFYGFTGPSYFLDTMCSAASTCIHEAVHMLRSGRCKMALAGGVSLLLHPQKLIAVSQEHFTSKTADVVRGYGLGADGTILGEGVGALVLKRRADAERDGDHIYGVIKGTAVTNAGVRNGFTVPSPAQQAAAVSKSIEDAGIDPRTIGYVEGHGSGTALGDPIEIRGLTQAYRAHTADTQFCAIGTVKSNVAHLLAAAGLAGVAKVLMQMKHGQLAPSLHAETLNPDIPFPSTPFYVQRALSAWPRVRDATGREMPRRAGITSIGAGGMNSHIIIEEHVSEPSPAHPGGRELVVLSAMNAAALVRLVTRIRDHIAAHGELSLADIAYTLQVGRTSLPCRLAVVATSRADLLSKLSVFLATPAADDGIWFTPNTLDREPHVDAASLADATAARALDRIAAWWADGIALDWDTLHAGRRPYRVSLPTYPFEKVRCWYPEFPDALSVLVPLAARNAAPRTALSAAHAPAGAPSAADSLTVDTKNGALVAEVTALAAGLLKFDAAQISPRASFYDLGFDSISLTRFASQIGERLGVTVSPAIFFECEHIDSLCRHLASRGARAPNAANVPAAVTRADGGRMKIAIVGVAARLPGADDHEAFIDRLLAGEDLTGSFPFERYDDTYADRLRRAEFAKRGGFLSDVDRFDAAFFRISPVEAERMDPQQRLMLETTWRALDSAGYRPDELPEDTGVFVGVSGRDYASLLEAHNVPQDGFAATGNSLAMVANRISYQLDVHGPSEAIDTACSSSLVALARAAEALAAGTCSMALVGGVNLALAVEGFEGPHLAGMLSSEGRCKTFSADADGYGRGEGVVALLLKPFADAETAGDRIFGVLVGSAVNHGGRAGALTAPNAKAQADLIVRAMDGIDPASIGYIETHGTGTALGDPVEVAALRLAYDRLASDGRSLTAIPLGAVKSNIGHLEAAAGLAGVVKVLSAMQRGEIPPTLHCRELNPHMELDGGPFTIQRERAAWLRRADASGAPLPRRAGVSSFGFGGVNAHVVLEEYPGGLERKSALPARSFADTRFWIPGHPGTAEPAVSDETVLLAPRWTEARLATSPSAPAYRRVVLACGVAVAAGSSHHIVDCDRRAGDIGTRYIVATNEALVAIQAELRRAAQPTLIQLVHPLDGDGALFAGLGALLDTATAEAPHIIGQTIGLPAGHSPEAAAKLLDEEARNPHHRRIEHEGGRRLVRTWGPVAAPRLAAPVWRDGDVHLITGGLGGLGRLITADIAARSKEAVLVLIGRSPLDAAGAAHLDALRRAGANAFYHAVDVTDASAVTALVDDVVRSHGALNSAIHCAGAIRDRTLLNKTRTDLEAVLGPKVNGSLSLAAACRGRGLDSFILFSSLAGAVGNAGQGDYAAANGFLDALAAARYGDLPVVSVNWPFWRDGGMRLDDRGLAAFFEQMGQRPLATEAGLAALGAAQQTGRRQIAVCAGDGARIRAFFAAAAANRVLVPMASPSAKPLPAPQRLAERAADALRHLLARVTGVAAGRIDADTPLDEYGIDSLMITRLNKELGHVFGPLSSSLLFEHRTLGALARHLAERHPDGCHRLLGEESAATAPAAPVEETSRKSAVSRSAAGSASTDREPIAIIGMSGRYPGAETLDAFWRNLAEGRDLVGEVPPNRWALDDFFEPDVEAAVAKGASYGKWGAFLEGFADFDPLFFKIAPRDAAAMDPQERLFLMAAWAACEDAGYTRARLKARHDARVGVFAGVTKTGFALHGPFVSASGATVRPTTSFASVANRVSHVLDLNGPSLPIDTMCSSSLTAIHEAVTALRSGACEMALAGGVNLYLHPSNFVELSAARMLSPDGRCKSFGDRANGFVPGEGVGCVLLKPLSRALADGDPIHALIRGTAVNHGGRTNGYTVPNPQAQRDVIRAALENAGVDARAVTCIEAHGTGTDLGDPIEVAALTQAFETSTPERGFCSLGSVKTNIGHLEAAAGIAGLTKVVLQMKHGQLAPTLHADPPNPKLELAATPFRLQTERASWEGPRVAGISSFGAGGANAHVIVEEWRTTPLPAQAAASRGAFAVVLSARDSERLREAAQRLSEALEIGADEGAPLRLADIAFTLQVGREAMEERLAFEVTTLDALAAGLTAYLDGTDDHPGLYRGNARDHRAVMTAFAGDDEDIRALVRSWVARGSIGRLLALWVQGLHVDWESLPRDGDARIVSLPTYPFARERYWIPTKPLVAQQSVGLSEVRRQSQETDALLASREALDTAIAPLVTAIVAKVPNDDLSAPFGRWRKALASLVPSGPAMPTDAAWDAWARFKASADPGLAPQIALAEVTLRALPDILLGKRAAPSVMFPSGQLDLVEAVYKDNAVATRFSAALASTAAAWVKARLTAKPRTSLRVLEIGAGTGGTSEPVFAALAPFGSSVAEYLYTDVSRAFLIKAEQRFSERVPALRTAMFDAEKPPDEQGIATGAYDVVIAANVLHATADIRQTLRNVGRTLTPGGVLLLNETSRATLFTHVTFGLLDGWWRFTDAELRIPGTPSLGADAWRAALEAEGFIWRSASEPDERRLGQQIIVAEAPTPETRNDAGVREALRRAVSETLNMPAASVALDKPFADYGLDSILGAELVERIRSALGIRIEQTRLYDFGSVLKLEDYIARAFPRVAPAQACPHETEPSPAVAAPVVSTAPAAPTAQREPIAIIGMSGRFAQSPDVEALWDHLNAGRNLVEPATRFSNDQERHGSFIESFDRFDPVFFGISGLEATYMDPQQRLFLEEAWKALEHAGHAGPAMEGRRCGVFVGCSAGDYQDLFRSQPPGQAFWGNTSSLIPARIAYCLDLKGPAIAVDTACSSSLVALDLACRSLWSGESEMALAGGVFVQCTDRFFRYADAARMLSPSGRCAAFGDSADGIVPGEAVACVMLRPLSAALADGDTIHGLIVASGTNQDGATNGITAPSGPSQQGLMRDVYRTFGIDAASIGFVEAHGTGTPLGDPIEYDALATVFHDAGAARGACLLGSVKSNLGHATTAAGITSLVKVLGALKTKAVPPSLHIGAGNPAIHLADGPFRINTEPAPWPNTSKPKQAAISSFGFSGTNAHVVVEEAPTVSVAADAGRMYPIALSARTLEQLRQQAERLVAHLKRADGQTLRDVAFTLLAGRRPLAHRLAFVADSLDDLALRLSRWLAGAADSGVHIATVDAGAARNASRELTLSDPTAVTVAFLAGEALDADAIFDGSPRRRVPLPVYPFAATRYWVEDTSIATAAASPSPPAVASVTPSRVLEPLSAVVPAATPRSVGKVKLAPLDVATSRTRNEPVRIVRDIGSDGICQLSAADAWSDALEAALAGELNAASEHADVRAVLLSVPAVWGAETTGGDAERFTEAVLECGVPVIAAARHSCSGPALGAVLACDFVVLAAEARIAAQGARGSDILTRRLGSDLAASLFAMGQCHTGAELKEAGLALSVTPDTQVDETARALASTIARAPRAALTELKNHMRVAPLHPGGAVPARETLRALAIGCNRTEHGEPKRVPLASRVVKIDAFGDGVAVIRMEERDGRNTFTPQLMDGLCEAFDAVARSSNLKAVVLTGFEGYFACGGTADGLESLQRGETHFTDRRIYSLPLECPLPVIAAMQGHAIGAGWALGMFSDLALFGAESIYHSNYLELGFTPGAGATLIFPRRLGDDLGREVLFSAMPFRGRDLKARAQGLHVMPAATVLPAALALAHGLAETSRDALIAAKSESVRAPREALPRVLERELEMHRRTFIGNAEVLARIRSAFPLAPEAPHPATRPNASARLGEVRAGVVDSLAEELMISAAEIRDGAGFLDLGLDSILAVTWIRRLNTRFGIELPATAVYAQPTVGALVARISEMLPAAPQVSVPEVPVVTAPAANRDSDAPPRALVRERVIASLAEELMIDAAEIRDSAGFLDLGLDSILAVTWIRRLNAAFGTDLPATAVYAHPTVGTLVDKIAGDAKVRTPITDHVAPVATPPAPTVVSAPEPAQATPVSKQSATSERRAIAIIGMSGRFPKAPNLAAFWANIRSGRDCITEVPTERWSIATHYDPDPQAPGKSYCKWMGAIDGVNLFDPGFFNITPREAELMDPQQRLFLMHAWHAIEDAGIDPTSLAGRACGVFVGSGPSGYAELIEERNAYSLLGAAGSILAARISYLLDLTGPAVSLDTACSSSLVSIAEACNSLVLGDSDLALAGGACVLIGPSMFVDTSKVSMLSKDGRCFTFDARANGFVPGEGVGVMLLKRLDDAVRDGDPIRAVIRGWGVNQDGKTNGIAAPNPQAQARLIRGIHDRFSIAADSIGLIECHGTGTALGDPIEVEGLATAFAGRGVREGSCAIGSVKSNVGHLLASAGVAGAMKAVLALEDATLPPTIHVEQPNPHVAIAGTPFFVNTQAQPWPEPKSGPRRAAVSAFGFSGTNAHLVLEAAPSVSHLANAGPWVLPISARSGDRLSAYARDLSRFIAATPTLDFAVLAATFQHGRTHFAVRRAIVFRGRDELLRALELLAADADAPLPSSQSPLDALAARWRAGETIAWPISSGQRIQAPGYPFAEERCWVANDPPPAMVAPLFALDVRPDGGITTRLVPDAATAALIADGLTELMLPLAASTAAERAIGQRVTGLKHMVWGRPASGKAASSWEVNIRPDEDGYLYEVTDPQRRWKPRHVGTLVTNAAELDLAPWPQPTDMRTLGAQARDVTSSWSRFAMSIGASDVISVHRSGGDLIARLSCAPSRAEAGLLHVIWRLIAFSEVNGHAPPPKVPFAMERFIVAEALSAELIVRITLESGAVTVAAHTAAGARALLIDRLIAREPTDMIELDVQEEMLQ